MKALISVLGGKLGILTGNHHEVVLEHVEASRLVDIALLHGIVHLALGGGDQHVGVRAAGKLLVQLARRQILRVLERHPGMILRVQLLYSVHGLRQRVRGEQLQLHGLMALRLGLLFGGLLRLAGLLLGIRRAADQGERPTMANAHTDASMMRMCFFIEYLPSFSRSSTFEPMTRRTSPLVSELHPYYSFQRLYVKLEYISASYVFGIVKLTFYP